MSYKLEISKPAQKELFKLPKEAVEKISGALDSLELNPRPIGSKKLIASEGYRIRIAAYRVLYTIDDEKRAIKVYRIGHRREVYRF